MVTCRRCDRASSDGSTGCGCCRGRRGRRRQCREPAAEPVTAIPRSVPAAGTRGSCCRRQRPRALGDLDARRPARRRPPGHPSPGRAARSAGRAGSDRGDAGDSSSAVAPGGPVNHTASIRPAGASSGRVLLHDGRRARRPGPSGRRGRRRRRRRADRRAVAARRSSPRGPGQRADRLDERRVVGQRAAGRPVVEVLVRGRVRAGTGGRASGSVPRRRRSGTVSPTARPRRRRPGRPRPASPAVGACGPPRPSPMPLLSPPGLATTGQRRPRTHKRLGGPPGSRARVRRG